MRSQSSLRLALRLNAIFSTASALLLFSAWRPLGELMGVDGRILIGVGAGLAGFAIQLLVTAARADATKLRREAFRHSMADLAWVVGSAAVVALDWLTPAGDWLMTAVALPVLALGLAQLRSLPPKPGRADLTHDADLSRA